MNNNFKVMLKFTTNAAVLIITTILCIFFLECMVRIMLPQYDPSGHVSFTISSDGTPISKEKGLLRQIKNTGDYNVSLQISPLGLRESKPLKTSTLNDYFVVGDSFSFGWGVDENNRFSNILDQLISGVRVFNISIPTDFSGYGKLVSYAKMYVNKARGMYRVKRFGSIKAKNLRLADPIWVNFMKAGEWNPSHFHHGVISLVAYLSVPPEIKIEREEAEHSIKSNQPTAGKIQWTYGESMHFSQTYYTATPQEGQVWLFPADLKHMVYPFKSDVERVSISCNIEAPNFEVNKII